MKFIDLFSGCGGLSQGFKQAKWQPTWAVEKLEAPSQSYRENFRCPVWAGDIQEFTQKLEEKTLLLPKVTAVIGGPPCQGFSPLGKMSAKAEKIKSHTDLNKLWSYFAKSVEIIEPDIILTENVPEFLPTEEFKEYESFVRRLGYHCDVQVLQAHLFGVPQKRKRAFLLGSRLGAISLPSPTNERATVRDAIGHLPLKPDGHNLHLSRNPTPQSLQRYKVVPEGGNRFDLMRKRPDITPQCWLNKPTGTTDVFGRLKWDEPSSTIRTEFFKPEKGRYLHPSAHRPITHREAACLQTFPDNFVFCGSKIEVARQIGEAVPPLLAYHIALQVSEHMKTHGREFDVGNITAVRSACG